jgi:hypothetical protein
MNGWNVIWFDGYTLRRTYVSPCDACIVVTQAMSLGVPSHGIIKIEREVA